MARPTSLFRLVAFVLVAGVTFGAVRDAIPRAVPESVGIDSDRLGRISPWLAEMIAQGRAAGFVTLVARRGKVIHHEAAGRLGLSSDRPMPLDALFDIASMTKPLAAAVALTLWEEGRITLDDPVSAHLPEFANPRLRTESGELVPAEQKMTVRHLFTHTSGVRDPRSRAENYAFPTMGAYMLEFAKLPLRSEPGSRWLYGDSLDVLGHLAERVAGHPLDSLLKDRVLDPLAMRDTHYWPPDSVEDRRALLVVNGKDDPQRLSREPPEAAEAKTFISGASGIHTTAADYWKFCQMLLNGGEFLGSRVLGPRTVSLMAENHLEAGTEFRPGLGYGLGVAVVLDRTKIDFPYSVGSFYWGGSQGTLFWIDPQEQLVGILMVQAVPRGGLKLRERFAALVYSSIVD